MEFYIMSFKNFKMYIGTFHLHDLNFDDIFVRKKKRLIFLLVYNAFYDIYYSLSK